MIRLRLIIWRPASSSGLRSRGRQGYAEDGFPVAGAMRQEIWLGCGQRVWGEAEGAADGDGSAVAGGKDVYVGVADHDGLGGGDRFAGDGGGFGDEGEEAVRVGFFCVEAVASVVLKEEAREVEVVADVA